MTSLRDVLKKKLTKKEQALLRASFDVIGDIAIIEVPKELKRKQKMIANTLLSLVKSINVVAVKEGSHKGKYRRQKLAVVAGEKRLTTQHTESGIKLKLDVSKCYFSPRLGTERLRIAKLIKKNERVLIAGSGIGPYPLVLSKNSKAKELIGVEFNPIAHKYAVENVKLNKINNVTLKKGDVRNVRVGKCDRIIAATPHNGIELTPYLLKFAKKGANIHILTFAPEDNLKSAAENVKAACKTKKRKCRISKVKKAGQHAVRKYRVCVDAKLD